MTKRKTISMTSVVFEHAERRALEMGYQDFSSYIQALIRADAGSAPATRPAALVDAISTPPAKSRPPAASARAPRGGKAGGRLDI